MKFKTKELVMAGIFAAVISILSQISFKSPFSPVSVTMQTFGVFLAPVLLGTRYGTLSMLVYILMGLFGLPVFSNFRGGPEVILGPSGGYIISFPIMVLVTGILMEKKNVRRLPGLIMLMSLGLIICYVLGTTWLAMVLKVDLWKGLMLGVIPFIPFDIFKMVISAFLGIKIRDALERAGLRYQEHHKAKR